MVNQAKTVQVDKIHSYAWFNSLKVNRATVKLHKLQNRS